MISAPVPVLAELFDTLPVGLVALDRHGRVVIFNRAEEHLAQRKKSEVIGRAFFVDVAPCMNVQELAGEFFQRIGQGSFERQLEFSFPFPVLAEPRDVLVTMRSFEAEGEPFGLLLVEDISLRRSIERMKESLAALLVHDLKNPLAAISANLGFLGSHAALVKASDAQDAIADSAEATDRLNRMVLNLLDITRLETNGMPLRRRVFGPRELLEAVARSNRAAAAGLRIEVEADPLLTVDADDDVLRRAVENLTDNAARYARERIVLRAVADERSVAFEVEDDGPGVPADVRASVFDRFSSRSSKRSNFGLGLTFVQLAARAHGGDAQVLDGRDGGALFRLTIARV